MTEVTKATDVSAVSPQDVVAITLPASSAYLSVLRTATAGLAARLDFTIDEIEDMRIAVDEASAMLLPQALPGAELTCEFSLDKDAMTVSVSVMTIDGVEPPRDTFAWTVLAALAGEVSSDTDVDKRVTITLCKHRSRSEA
ncbi:MAG TPA: anti-sigma regulatory factor [Mycobacteriales bacterium]|nr:anti-sigma regulatory factor [Mycobacteriales bacterium]